MSLAHATPLTDPERADRLRLARTFSVGPVTFRRLIDRFHSAAEALRALPDLARQAGAERLNPPSRAEAEDEIAALARAGGRFLALGEPLYPEPLAAVEDAPPLLALRGDPALLSRAAVGVVGSRNASAGGRRLAEELSRELGAAGLVVVSGLARGIDAAAHRGALASGTVAVFAGGLDQVYPPEHADLAQAILDQGGALVSEMPLGAEPQARHFPRRNRLVSGLSRGVLVIEAALKSGSLTTARFALEQGREVMAVPGSPLDPRCRGTNQLLREGAGLVETAADALLHLGLDPELALRPHSISASMAGPGDAAGDSGRPSPASDIVSIRDQIRPGETLPSPSPAARSTPGDAPQVPALASPPPRQGLVKENQASLGTSDGRRPAGDEAATGSESARKLAELLGSAPVSVDELVRRCQMSPPVVRAALLDLELAGRLERHPGDRVSLLPT
ncbi:DNA processing protein DprA [Hypericibacter adhaerens]|uniref:DNA processing protein DprA n=1 Tax=Hypericibacter adhaerens TaxID=2602016 RepID=A0A5J6N290_9PROT|nr:DNA-processing protein DprA [Hypericibacter adhaerens]QEX23105.1 DNA processing protein DprA [Hypericibacter adhaerens]